MKSRSSRIGETEHPNQRVREAQRAVARAHWLKIAIAIAFLSIAVRGFFAVTPVQLQSTVLSFGSAAAVGYVLIFLVLSLVFFPTTVLAIAGGMAFGPVRGTTYALIAATLSAAVAFAIGRKFSRTALGVLLHTRATKLQLLGQHAISTLFILRQFAPYDAVSYAAGLSRISVRDFFFGSTLGTIPGLLLAVALGDTLLEQSANFLIPLALLLVLMAGAYFWEHHHSAHVRATRI